MKILSCDTSTLLGSVAVSDGSRVLSFRSIQRAGSHSDTLNSMIQDCLSESKLELKNIDLFLSGLGPGSFTGIRISLNTIKTLAYVYQKPCSGLDSLYMIAENAKFKSESITVMINAFKNMVYIAEYSVTQNILNIVKPPQVVRVQELSVFLNPSSLILGDGFLSYKDYFENIGLKLRRPHDSALDFPLAATMCHVYGQKNYSNITTESLHWSKLLPIYLRASEAEENLQGIKYLPLAMR